MRTVPLAGRERTRRRASASKARLVAALSALTVLVAAVPAAEAQPPTASFTASPETPLTNEAVTLASTSTDADGDSLTYAWELDGADDDFNEASGPTAQWQFATPGRRTVRLRVSDAGSSTTASMTIAVRNRPPVADFVFFPASPKEGEVLELASLSTDSDGQIATQAWDLDGDGQFDDWSGPTARVSFFRFTGTRSIRLQVVDTDGAADVRTRTVTFAPALGPLLSPFPVVRMMGRAMRRATLVRRLTVRAPAGSRIVIRCAGAGCPARRLVARASRRVVRLRRLERRLAAGAVVKIFVTKPRTVGKYTQFRIRSGRPPLRRDRCAVAGSIRPIPCPEG